MKRSPRPHQNGKGPLSSEEHALWQHTAGSVEPLRRKKQRVIAALEALESAHAAPTKRHETREHRGHHAPEYQPVTGKAAHVPHAAPANPPSRRPALAEFDRKKAKRIRSGRHEIEARIDLHGMRQAEAHAALERFIVSCQAQGKRTVLVITGKGVPSTRGRMDHSNGDVLDSETRGVLRRNVPRWLAEPSLRAHVVSFTDAAARHGGDGALYVHLRNAARFRHD